MNSAANTWKLFPWLVAVCIAPLLFGSVDPQQQALIAGLLAISWLLLSFEIAGREAPCWRHWAIGIVVLFGCILPLVPLPLWLVEVVSPERARTARALAIDGNAPTSATLTVSIVATVQRLWELTIIVVGYQLARFSAANSRNDLWLVRVLAVGVTLLAASKLWFLVIDNGKLLGIWERPTGEVGGTFANRNHFVNWIVVGCLFLLGAFTSQRSRIERAMIAVAMAFGLSMAVTSGSRAGMSALVIGLIVWMTLVGQAKEKRVQVGAALAAVIGILFVILSGSEFVLGRLPRVGSDFAFKWSIWEDALSVAMKYPLFGTGLGAFERAFNYYKTFRGESTFLHAENEWVQLLMETGIVVTALLIALGAHALWRCRGILETRGRAGHELRISAVAGMAAFLAHSIVEFLFQITGTALLAATIMGFIVGSRGRMASTIVPPLPTPRRIAFNIGTGCCLLALAGLQGLSWGLYESARSARPTDAPGGIERSLRLWPWNSERAIGLARSLAPGDNNLRAEAVLRASIRSDSWNWRLRLEALLLRIRSGEDSEALRTEARQVVRLNPLQTKLPIYLAREFALIDPELAVEFLSIAAQSPSALGEALSLALQLEFGTDVLWSLTPNTDIGMQTLGDVAASNGLLAMARAAYGRLSPRTSVIQRAENHLKANEPQKALALIDGSDSGDALLRARIYAKLERFAEALHLAAELWVRNHPSATRPSEVGSLPIEEAAAVLAAEESFGRRATERNLAEVRERAGKFPSNARLQWIALETERELGLYAAAAQRAIALASRLPTTRGRVNAVGH